jgi:UDP-4-amino-4,6-dideoxy-N-acetyl-beta-L-altrosamine N-acetyltransferase
MDAALRAWFSNCGIPEGEPVIALREITVADRDMLRTWRNQPDVAKYMYSDHHITEPEHAAWFAGLASDATRRHWIIVCDGVDVGLVSLYRIDTTHKRCAWAFYLASPDVRGKGIGSFVEYAVLRHVFDELGLYRLSCEVLATNEQVIQMHESFGFRREATFREHVVKEGQRVDVISLAVLRPEWEADRHAIVERLSRKGLLSEELPA